MTTETPAAHLDRLILALKEALVICDCGNQPLVGARLSQTLEAALQAKAALPALH